jgi:hypothetical protein
VQVVVGLLEACAHADKRLGLVPSFGNTVTLAIQLYVAQGFGSGEVSPPGSQAGRRACGRRVCMPGARFPCKRHPLTTDRCPTPPCLLCACSLRRALLLPGPPEWPPHQARLC